MDPLKSARGPPGPEKKLGALIEAPGTLRAAPRGALGPPRGTFAGHVTSSFLLLVLHKPAKVPKITKNHKKIMRFPENHDKFNRFAHSAGPGRGAAAWWAGGLLAWWAGGLLAWGLPRGSSTVLSTT